MSLTSRIRHIIATVFIAFIFLASSSEKAIAQPITGIGYNDTCFADITIFNFTYNGAIPDSVLWTFGDATNAPDDTSTIQTNAPYTYSDSGNYTVTLIAYWTNAGNVVTDTSTTNVNILPPLTGTWPDTTSLCASSIVLDATYPQTGTTYLWSTGSTNSSITVTNNGIYFYEAITPCGTLRDTTFVQLFPQLTVNLGPDFAICTGDTLQIDANLNFNNGVTYTWSNGGAGSQIDVFAAGDYSVTVTDSCYTAVDTVTVTIPPNFTFTLGPDTVLCPGDTIVLDPNINQTNIQYFWNNGSMNPTRTITSGGTYWLQASNDCIFPRDTIEIYMPGPFTFDLGPDTTICNGDTLTLDPTAGLPTEVTYDLIWSDGSTTTTFDITAAGTYYVTVSDPCTSYSDSITVDIPSGINVALGNDTTICQGDTITISPNLVGPNYSYIWSTGATTSSIDVTTTGQYWVEVSDDCNISSDTIEFLPYQGITVDIGSDTTICSDKPYFITLDYPQSTYTWQDGSSSATYEIDGPGEYFVQVENICDTVESNTIRVDIEPCECAFYVPNAFTPNRDGSNEIFQPVTQCIVLDYELRIYDRWGNKLFYSFDFEVGWNGEVDGEVVPQGQYLYRIFYRIARETGEIYQESLFGPVHVVR